MVAVDTLLQRWVQRNVPLLSCLAPSHWVSLCLCLLD